jgi:hypothetical protein
MAAQHAEAGNEDSNEATEEYDNDPMGVPFPDMDKGENPFQTALDHFIKSELCN